MVNGIVPTIAEVKQAWIEEATRVGLIEGAEDTVGLQRLKKVLGWTHESLLPGCKTEACLACGLALIRRWRATRLSPRC